MIRFGLCVVFVLLSGGHTSASAQEQLPPVEYAVQVAAFRTAAEAQAQVVRLQHRGLSAYQVKANLTGRGIYYRVRFGRFASGDEATRAGATALNGKLIAQFVIVDYEPPLHGPAPAHRKRRVTPEDNALSMRAGNSLASAVAWAAPREGPAGAADLLPERIAPVPLHFTATLSALPASVLSRATVADERAATLPPAPEIIPVITISNPRWQVSRAGRATDANLNAVYFTDAARGWAAGDAGIIYRTSDGGVKWERLVQLAGLNIVSLYFADAWRGWLIAQPGDGEQDARDESQVWRTLDGGRTWQPQRLSGITRLQFINSSRGWAVGRHAALFSTTDGGAEWQPYDGLAQLFGAPVEGATYNFGFSDVHFTDAEHGWATGNFYGRTRTHIGGLFATNDGGHNWRRVALPVSLPNLDESMPRSAGSAARVVTGRIIQGELQAVRFSDEQHGLVSGEITDGKTRWLLTLHTQDGGRSWQQFQTPGLSADQAGFISAAQGWVIMLPQPGDAAATTLRRTDDGGVTWRDELRLHGHRIRGLFFLSSDQGWAVGERGLILRYQARQP